MKLTLSSVTALLAIVLSTTAQTKVSAPKPTGTWELRTGTSGSTRMPPQFLIIKFDAGKLSGTLSRPAGRTVEQLPLENAKLDGNHISFAVHSYAVRYENNVLQPTDTNRITRSFFEGQITGDVMKGKVEEKSWREEGNRTLDWEAKRTKGTGNVK